jgi:hypothetical protein
MHIIGSQGMAGNNLDQIKAAYGDAAPDVSFGLCR